MLVRNCGIRDISEITGCCRYKVQKVLKISQHHVLPKKNHYDALEVDELWTFVGNKKNKVWLIVKSLIKSNESKEPKQQDIHISQPPLFPQPFDPCPCLLYRIKIRAIGWKPQHPYVPQSATHPATRVSALHPAPATACERFFCGRLALGRHRYRSC